jgi:uncharacterized membrane protein YcaP (DUF421 family)
VTAEPTLLLRDGAVLAEALRDQRLTEAEVMQAVRGSGSGALENVAAVVLETDGSMSVIRRGEQVPDLLTNVRR